MPSPESDNKRNWNSLISVLSFFGSAVPRKRVVSAADPGMEPPEHQLLRRRLRAGRLIAVHGSPRLCHSTHSGGKSQPGPQRLLCVWWSGCRFLRDSVSPPYLHELAEDLEFTVFVGMALDFSLSLNDRLASVLDQVLTDSSGHSAALVELVAAIKDHILALFALMMIYGMFIPNTGLRAAGMVALMALMSMVVILSNKVSREGLDSFRQSHSLAVDRLRSSNLLSLAIGAGCAVYGTIVINELRRRAQSAEELGQYRLMKKLGSGGMGDVYLAEHRLLRRLCAVKLIRSDQADDQRCSAALNGKSRPLLR